jgi:hypothetical protein
MKTKSTRRLRFENVAAKRTQKILDFLDSLSKCANRTNYEYNEEDVKKMFKAIKDQVNNCEGQYFNELKKKSKNQFKF